MRDYQKATAYVCDTIEHAINVDGRLIGAESTFAEYVFQFSEVYGVRIVYPEDVIDNDEMRGECYYSVHPLLAPILVNLAELDEGFFDYCLIICACNLRLGYPLEPSLGVFSSRVLQGYIKRPTKRSRPRNREWTEKFRMWMLVQDVSQQFALNVTRNDEVSGRYSACDAVAEGLTVCGRITKYSEIKNLMTHPDYKRLRMECEAAFAVMQRSNDLSQSEVLDGGVRDLAIIDALEADVLDIVRTFPAVDENYTFDT